MKKILFFGELPPKTIHGVSFSNEINIEILNRNFVLNKVVEFTPIQQHQRITGRKIVQLLGYGLSVIKNKIRNGRYDFFYLPLSISFQGVIKVLYLIALFRLLNRNSKVILHIFRSDLPSFYHKSGANRFLIDAIFKLTEKVIILSELMIDERFRGNSIFTVVPNTVKYTLEDYPSEKQNEFLFISHYIESKGIFDLLEAVKPLGGQSIKLNCYGQFTNSVEKKRVLSYENEMISINSFIDEEKKLFKIAESICLILPSHNEGQPQIIFEAMSVGTPIIATRVGDTINMLGQDYPFLVEANSVLELRDAVLRFTQLSKREKSELSTYVKDRFARNFSMSIHEQALVSVFEN